MIFSELHVGHFIFPRYLTLYYTPLLYLGLPKNEGLEICKSPKSCFKQAFKQGWIVKEESYAVMVQNRNLTTYTYNEELAEEIYNSLSNYLSLLESLLEKLNSH